MKRTALTILSQCNVLVGHLGFWCLCGFYFDTFHQLKHCCRQSTSSPRSAMQPGTPQKLLWSSLKTKEPKALNWLPNSSNSIRSSISGMHQSKPDPWWTQNRILRPQRISRGPRVYGEMGQIFFNRHTRHYSCGSNVVADWRIFVLYQSDLQLQYNILFLFTGRIHCHIRRHLKFNSGQKIKHPLWISDCNAAWNALELQIGAFTDRFLKFWPK